MGIVEILIALLKIFSLMIPGFLLKKMQTITPVQIDGFSSMITRVTYPCLVISAMQMEYSPKVLHNSLYIILIYTGIILTAFLLSIAVSKLTSLPHGQKRLLTFMLIFGNTGFIGLPVLNGLFGKEAVFYGAICDATCDVILFTAGIAILRSSVSEHTGTSVPPENQKSPLKEILNPCTVGLIIGLILYVTNTTLPEVLAEPVSLLGSATTPLAMFIIGAQIADINPGSLFGDRHIYLVCVLKLAVIPAVAFFLARLVIDSASLLSTVVVIEAAMPAATVTVIFTRQFHGDVEFAVKGVLMSTLLCVITIPITAVTLSML